MNLIDQGIRLRSLLQAALVMISLAGHAEDAGWKFTITPPVTSWVRDEKELKDINLPKFINLDEALKSISAVNDGHVCMGFELRDWYVAVPMPGKSEFQISVFSRKSRCDGTQWIMKAVELDSKFDVIRHIDYKRIKFSSLIFAQLGLIKPDGYSTDARAVEARTVKGFADNCRYLKIEVRVWDNDRKSSAQSMNAIIPLGEADVVLAPKSTVVTTRGPAPVLEDPNPDSAGKASLPVSK